MNRCLSLLYPLMISWSGMDAALVTSWVACFQTACKDHFHVQKMTYQTLAAAQAGLLLSVLTFVSRRLMCFSFLFFVAPFCLILYCPSSMGFLCARFYSSLFPLCIYWSANLFCFVSYANFYYWKLTTFLGCAEVSQHQTGLNTTVWWMPSIMKVTYPSFQVQLTTRTHIQVKR